MSIDNIWRFTVSLLRRIFRELSPPFLYKLVEGFYSTHRYYIINSENKFSEKVFCIGFNKTGTTSVEQALSNFGYCLGNYGIAVMLLFDWYRRDCSRLIRFCQTAQAFQDIPFSLPETYRYLDEAFPDAKFILTIRDSKDLWFQSLVKYHTKRFSSDKSRPPTQEDLGNTGYPYKGFLLDMMKAVYNYPTVTLYDYEYYTTLYERHNSDVIQYFQGRPDKLQVLNLSRPNAYQELASFLNVTISQNAVFPWENKT